MKHSANSLSNMTFRRTLELFTIFFFSEISDLIGAKMLGKSTPFFQRLFWESMEIREKSGSSRGDLIDFLINLKNSEQHPDYGTLIYNTELKIFTNMTIETKYAKLQCVFIYLLFFFSP